MTRIIEVEAALLYTDVLRRAEAVTADLISLHLPVAEAVVQLPDQVPREVQEPAEVLEVDHPEAVAVVETDRKR